MSIHPPQMEDITLGVKLERMETQLNFDIVKYDLKFVKSYEEMYDHVNSQNNLII